MAPRKSRAGGLAKAIAAAKTITALTDRINAASPPERRLTVQAVSQWDEIPAERCLDVERATGVSRYVLRPDIYGKAPSEKGARPSVRVQARAAA